MTRTELLRFARLGARARLEALQVEIEGLLRRFPGLAAEGTSPTRRRGPGRPRVGAQAAVAETVKPVRRRRKMSAAARKKISEAQKRRWAKQKAGKK